MNEAIKKKNQAIPVDYSPKTPALASMMEALCSEKVIDTVVIEGVEFTIIEKAKTLYAGSYFIAPDYTSEPDTMESWQWYKDNSNKIIDSATPDCMICISIDYQASDRCAAMIHGQETTNINQPEGIHVLVAEPTIMIRVKATKSAWKLTKKLTGEGNPKWHMAPLFGLIRHIFCDGEEYDYEFNGCNGRGNEETEYYYSNGDQYVTVPVKRIVV